MSRPRIAGVRQLKEIAWDDPARGRVVTTVSGSFRFAERDAETRDREIARVRGLLTRRYGAGHVAIDIEDNLHRASFVFTPAA